jgi:hypothetical protein
MNRKQRRTLKKKMNKDMSQNFADKILQFENLPDQCLSCLKPYDKTSKEMAMTWNVVVRDETTIRLYCPDCWEKATAAVEAYKKEKENESSTD